MHRYPDFPSQVYVELTNACNAQCTICATPKMARKRQIMDIDLFRKIVDECGRRQVKKILPFLHGESLLVPGVLEYFRYIRKASPASHVNLTTNGSRLTPELTEAFLQEELLDSVIISFDGSDKSSYEAIRKGLSYDQVRSNVLGFIRRRNELGKTFPKVSIAMVVVESNNRLRDEFRRVWNEADEVRFSVYFNWAGRLQSSERSQNKINWCERLNRYMTILADGRLAMCCFDSEAEYQVGDARNQSLYEAWHSKQFREKRLWLFERNFERLPICGHCDFVNHPSWTAPLIRLLPVLQEKAPRMTEIAGNLYKKWLMRQ